MLKRIALIVILSASQVAAVAQVEAQTTEADVFSLEASVLAGDRSAMRRLLSLETDGAVAEYVSQIMGRAIRKHPSSFLEEVGRTARANCDPCLDSLLGDLGDDFVDKFPEQVDELTKRKQALLSVKSIALRPFRDKCIQLLDKQISQIQSLMRQGVAISS